jgi:hypothetical protein
MTKDNRVASDILRGNTLRVYLCLLKHNGGMELRDVQRELQLSTPSLASYHLSRLVRAGYAEQTNDGRYRAAKDVSTEVLEGYSKIGIIVVPQLFFFSLLFTILITFFLYETTISQAYLQVFPWISILAVAALWFETIRLWRRLVTWS